MTLSSHVKTSEPTLAHPLREQCSSSLSIIIHDDEDITSPLLLFNNSPQISGRDLTAYYNLTGCARVTCKVRNQEDCSQPIGSSEGVWFGQSAINRRTLRQFAITVDAYCPNQIVPVFEDRPIRNDNTQCSQHFTDQQYEFDPASGNVTVEWEGTGPDATVQVSQFMCILPNTGIFSWVSMVVVILLLFVVTTVAVVGALSKRRHHEVEVPESDGRVDWSSTFAGIEQPNEAYASVLKNNIAYGQIKKPQGQRIDDSQAPATTEGEYEIIEPVHVYEDVLPQGKASRANYVNVN